jgi:hypothetical protein
VGGPVFLLSFFSRSVYSHIQETAPKNKKYRDRPGMLNDLGGFTRDRRGREGATGVGWEDVFVILPSESFEKVSRRRLIAVYKGKHV